MTARWEVVRTPAGWHGRYRAANGQIVWVTESHTRRRGVLRAVELIAGPITESPFADWPEVTMRGEAVEVRTTDERSPR